MSFMISRRRSSTSACGHDRRSEFCVISRPEVATPPALLALPGAYSTPDSRKTSTASSVLGMFAPSATHLTLLATSWRASWRSEEHTSELQSLMRISYAVFCLKKKKHMNNNE